VSAFATYFKQPRESNACIDGTNLKQKGIHASALLKVANLLASNG
jgi:hypothetical protein